MTRVLKLLPALAAALSVCAFAAPLFAEPGRGDAAAQLDTQIRPDFGPLLREPLRERRAHPRHDVWYGHRRGWGEAPRAWRTRDPWQPYGRDSASITVDCNDGAHGPTPISDAAARVPDGGVVYVRSEGQACRESIEIDHPVTIAAEEASAYSTTPASKVVIAPPEGAPCVLVAEGVTRVEVRGFKLVDPMGGAASCVEAWDSEVALTHDDIDYAGDASAVSAAGGRLIVTDSRIDAHTYEAAVSDEAGALKLVKDRIRADAVGVYLTLGPAESLIDQVGVLASKSSAGGSVGIAVRGERSGGASLTVKNGVVCGFRVGFGIERGARANIRRGRICRASYGVMSEGADIVVEENAIGAERYGVYLASGTARVDHNRIYDIPRPFDGVYGETGGITEGFNWLYPRPGCGLFHRDAHRYCRDKGELPSSVRDEDGFDRDEGEGWSGDGYDKGYDRDGPVSDPDAH